MNLDIKSVFLAHTCSLYWFQSRIAVLFGGISIPKLRGLVKKAQTNQIHIPIEALLIKNGGGAGFDIKAISAILARSDVTVMLKIYHHLNAKMI
jgi:hypothetical protein